MQVRFHEMQDLEINSFAIEAGWSDDWVMVRLRPRGKARGRPPAINRYFRMVRRPQQEQFLFERQRLPGLTTGTALLLLLKGTVPRLLMRMSLLFLIDGGGSAVADVCRAAVADAASADG